MDGRFIGRKEDVSRLVDMLLATERLLAKSTKGAASGRFWGKASAAVATATTSTSKAVCVIADPGGWVLRAKRGGPVHVDFIRVNWGQAGCDALR